MSSQVQTFPIETASLTDRAKAKTFACADGQCDKKFLPADKAFVPNKEYLLEQTQPGQRHPVPLNLEELARFVRCKFHAFNQGAQRELVAKGVRMMYPLLNTCRWMDQLAAYNAAFLARQQNRAHRSERHQRAAIPYDFVNQTLTKMAKPKEDKPRPKHRERTHRVHVAYTGPKRYGGERSPSAPVAETQQQKKGKQNDKQGNGHRKGR